MTDINAIDFAKSGGLVPVIVQHARTRQVLMLGYMNEDALRQTVETGQVTFFSRSKNRLWVKGETSGHTLRLVSLRTDCDRDALLVEAEPAGPVCHLGTTGCFDDGEAPGVGFLEALASIIHARREADPKESYVARLLAAGPLKAAQKVGEEGVEVALAAAAQDDHALTEEAADLVFHLMVALEARGVAFSDVVETLRSRHASSLAITER
ncbi:MULTISPECIES: bifunctional phosphoribosyl-AMP cyclohydrolase/phosphoribosyl-ATP diphosphatase HisIE [Hyphobacterium]|uniref:Histidine biosynthesis bifunctional protein HisIE n=1 Tax=Hyphobacterium vulgare TaxID=1736751 RepID=A0ABV6ZTJ5_9PROT